MSREALLAKITQIEVNHRVIDDATKGRIVDQLLACEEVFTVEEMNAVITNICKELAKLSLNSFEAHYTNPVIDQEIAKMRFHKQIISLQNADNTIDDVSKNIIIGYLLPYKEFFSEHEFRAVINHALEAVSRSPIAELSEKQKHAVIHGVISNQFSLLARPKVFWLDRLLNAEHDPLNAFRIFVEIDKELIQKTEEFRAKKGDIAENDVIPTSEKYLALLFPVLNQTELKRLLAVTASVAETTGMMIEDNYWQLFSDEEKEAALAGNEARTNSVVADLYAARAMSIGVSKQLKSMLAYDSTTTKTQLDLPLTIHSNELEEKVHNSPCLEDNSKQVDYWADYATTLRNQDNRILRQEILAKELTLEQLIGSKQIASLLLANPFFANKMPGTNLDELERYIAEKMIAVKGYFRRDEFNLLLKRVADAVIATAPSEGVTRFTPELHAHFNQIVDAEVTKIKYVTTAFANLARELTELSTDAATLDCDLLVGRLISTANRAYQGRLSINESIRKLYSDNLNLSFCHESITDKMLIKLKLLERRASEDNKIVVTDIFKALLEAKKRNNYHTIADAAVSTTPENYARYAGEHLHIVKERQQALQALGKIKDYYHELEEDESTPLLLKGAVQQLVAEMDADINDHYNRRASHVAKPGVKPTNQDLCIRLKATIERNTNKFPVLKSESWGQVFKKVLVAIATLGIAPAVSYFKSGRVSFFRPEPDRKIEETKINIDRIAAPAA